MRSYGLTKCAENSACINEEGEEEEEEGGWRKLDSAIITLSGSSAVAVTKHDEFLRQA